MTEYNINTLVFLFFLRLRRGAPLRGARHRCAAQGTAVRCGTPAAPVLLFFFAAVPRVTLCVTPRGAAARREALLRSARHRCAVWDAYGIPPRARNSGRRPLFCAYGAHAAPQVPQTYLKTFPLPQCIILQNFMSFRPVV